VLAVIFFFVPMAFAGQRTLFSFVCRVHHAPRNHTTFPVCFFHNTTVPVNKGILLFGLFMACWG